MSLSPPAQCSRHGVQHPWKPGHFERRHTPALTDQLRILNSSRVWIDSRDEFGVGRPVVRINPLPSGKLCDVRELWIVGYIRSTSILLIRGWNLTDMGQWTQLRVNLIQTFSYHFSTFERQICRLLKNDLYLPEWTSVLIADHHAVWSVAETDWPQGDERGWSWPFTPVPIKWLTSESDLSFVDKLKIQNTYCITYYLLKYPKSQMVLRPTYPYQLPLVKLATRYGRDFVPYCVLRKFYCS